VHILGLVMRATQIGNFTLCLGLPIMFGSCSCDNNPVTPPEEKPTLLSAAYPEYTNNRSISGRLDYEGKADSAVVEIDGIEYRLGINPDSTVDVELPSGDGEKVLNTNLARADGDGIESKVILDQTKPSANSIIIPSNTTSRDIEARISADGADSMKIAEDLSAAVFIPYSDSANINLSASEGQKNVYVFFRDKAGNLSDTLSAATNLDITSPIIPGAFHDTTLNDQTVDFGSFAIAGLMQEYFKRWGATADSGSLADINKALYNEGLTYVEVFMQDSAGNSARDTARVSVAKLDSGKVLSEIVDFYLQKGYSPIDSLKQFTVTDSLFRSYAERFNYTFRLNADLSHHVKVSSAPDTNAVKAADYTTKLSKELGMPDRFLIAGPSFLTPLNQKLLNFYNQNMQ
jgi:hypothetical protein